VLDILLPLTNRVGAITVVTVNGNDVDLCALVGISDWLILQNVQGVYLIISDSVVQSRLVRFLVDTFFFAVAAVVMSNVSVKMKVNIVVVDVVIDVVDVVGGVSDIAARIFALQTCI
jgi:hypothetical protein